MTSYQYTPPTSWLATNTTLPTPWLSLPMQSSHPMTCYQLTPPTPRLATNAVLLMTVTTNALLPTHNCRYQCTPPTPWLALPMQSSYPMTVTTNALLPWLSLPNALLPHHGHCYKCNPPTPQLTTNAILPSHDWYYQCNPPIPWLVLPMQSSHSVTVTTNATLLTFCVNEILQGLGWSFRLKQYNTELTDPLLCLLWLKSRRPSPRASRWELSPMAEQKVFLRWLWDENFSLVMITAGSWMSSPWVKRVKLAIKNKMDLSRFSSLLVSHSYGDALLFSRTSHRTDCT